MTEVTRDFVVMLVSQVLMVFQDVQAFPVNQDYLVNRDQKARVVSLVNRVSKNYKVLSCYYRSTWIPWRRWSAR